jgi:hypothetical protein
VVSVLARYLKRHHLALIAIFIGLGGGAYAVTTAKKNSVTSKSIKNSAVRSVDVKDEALTGADILESSLQGLGPSAADPLPEVLPLGETLRGTYAVRYVATGIGSYVGDISFGYTFASAPTPHFIAIGAPTPPECPGNANNPQALPGHLCVHETSQTNRSQPSIVDIDFTVGAEPWGALIVTASTASGDGGTSGSWAATSP